MGGCCCGGGGGGGYVLFYAYCVKQNRFYRVFVSKLRSDVFNSCMKLNLSATVALRTGETGRCREV